MSLPHTHSLTDKPHLVNPSLPVPSHSSKAMQILTAYPSTVWLHLQQMFCFAVPFLTSAMLHLFSHRAYSLLPRFPPTSLESTDRCSNCLTHPVFFERYLYFWSEHPALNTNTNWLHDHTKLLDFPWWELGHWVFPTVTFRGQGQRQYFSFLQGCQGSWEPGRCMSFTGLRRTGSFLQCNCQSFLPA